MQDDTLTHESDNTTGDSPGEPDSLAEQVETGTKQPAQKAPQAASLKKKSSEQHPAEQPGKRLLRTSLRTKTTPGEDAIGQPGKRSRRDTMPRSSVAASTTCSVLNKSRLAEVIATETELKKKTVRMILDGLTSVATQQVRVTGKVTIPGLCTIKTRMQNAIEPQEPHLFGRILPVKAQAAQTIVKINTVAKSIAVWLSKCYRFCVL